MYGFMSAGSHVERGFKKIQADEETLFTLPSLQQNHGLLVGEDLVWHDALDKIPDAERAYMVALLRRGEKFNAEPRITCSTIHGAKGGEADNVVLMTDLTTAADNERQIEPDNLNRVFYVGVTRTRQKLYIVEPENAYRSFEI
jgi:superfamily I DNA/RNA helicase